MDRNSNPRVEVRVPLQLVQDALGRLDQQVCCAHMHVEHDEDSYKHDKEARRECAC